MGCGGSVADVGKPGKRQTVFGVFEIKLVEAQIMHQTSKFSTMDPYVKIKFSNQEFRGNVVKNGGKNPKFSDKHTFIVNSCFKHFGRCLEVELMDSNITSDDIIGYGIIDLDPYLNALHVKAPPESEIKPENAEGSVVRSVMKSQLRKTILRCFLNFDRKQAGIVTLEAAFREEPVDIISFRFETADLERSTRTFGDMECYVRVTAGEQVLETSKSKDTKLAKPVWKDEHVTFHCPSSLSQIQIDIMDENKLVGSVEMDKKDLLIDDSENQFAQEIIYDRKVIGKLFFNTKKNANPLFKELKGDYKKKQPEKPQQNKPQENKPQQSKPAENKPAEGAANNA